MNLETLRVVMVSPPPDLEKRFQSAEYFIRGWERDCQVANALGGGQACR